MSKTILDCGHEPSEHSEFTTGYGTDPTNGKKYCYACCARKQWDEMVATGKATLYFDEQAGIVTDWPGHLRFKLYPQISMSKHNMARKRYDYWFRGPDGYDWHGYTIGDNTQIAHCKRTKTK